MSKAYRKAKRIQMRIIMSKTLSLRFNVCRGQLYFLQSWIKRPLPHPSFCLSFFEPLPQLWELEVLSRPLVIAGVCRVIRFFLSYLLSSCPQYNDNHRDLNAKAAWQLGYTGKGVVVSILDDGIERNHPDLTQNYVSKKKNKKKNCAWMTCFGTKESLLL